MAVAVAPPTYPMFLFQSLKGFQRFCGEGDIIDSEGTKTFQSLKGFQRFCGGKRAIAFAVNVEVSIPKRVSEVLWQKPPNFSASKSKFQSLKGFQRFCGHHHLHQKSQQK